MSVNDTKLSSALIKQMAWGTARAKVLADNMAHADNPGYQRKELKGISFSGLIGDKMIEKPGLKITSPSHLKSTSFNSQFEEFTQKNTLLSSQDNGVNPETEMVEISGNANKMEFLMNIYKKQRALFDTALGKHNGG